MISALIRWFDQQLESLVLRVITRYLEEQRGDMAVKIYGLTRYTTVNGGNVPAIQQLYVTNVGTVQWTDVTSDSPGAPGTVITVEGEYDDPQAFDVINAGAWPGNGDPSVVEFMIVAIEYEMGGNTLSTTNALIGADGKSDIMAWLNEWADVTIINKASTLVLPTQTRLQAFNALKTGLYI